LLDSDTRFYSPPMKSGILREDEGFDIFVDGQKRSFRDMKAVALEAAQFLKTPSKYKDRVEVVVRATGERIDMP
jgi:hypothetical protein